MSQYTSAYSNFIERLQEVEYLIKLGKVESRTSSGVPSPNSVRVLCRSGVVLLCSHIEGYITELVDVILLRLVEKNVERSKLSDKFFYYFSRDLLNEIGNANNSAVITTKVRKLIARDSDIWAINKNFSSLLSWDQFLSNFASPNFSNIRKLFSRFGCDDYTKSLGSLLKSDYPICTNMVNQVVDQRNKIAHGDTVVTATPKDLEDMLKIIRIFCR